MFKTTTVHFMLAIKRIRETHLNLSTIAPTASAFARSYHDSSRLQTSHLQQLLPHADLPPVIVPTSVPYLRKFR